MATTIAYSTDSAGMHPNHTLPLKLRAISDVGFTQVEIAFPDLEEFAAQGYPGYKKLDASGKGDLEELCSAAGRIKALCDDLGLKVLVIHPFSKFEGYQDVRKKAESLERAVAWFKVMKILDCQMLQVGSSDDSTSSGNFDEIAADLRRLADEAAAQQPPIRIAYEMWAWGVHVNTWEHTFDICNRVDRSNFGLCLDTFQICARTYVDPAKPTADMSTVDARARLQKSLQNLADADIAPHIFYLQVSDGSRNVSADALEHDAQEQGIDVLYAWSNAWRPLPFVDEVSEIPEKHQYKGFLPVIDVIKAISRTGWEGPWSYEVFYKDSMSSGSVKVPRSWTAAAKRAHERILECLTDRDVSQ